MASTMLNADSRAKRAVIAMTASLTILSFAAAPALADRRSPAPIVFAGQGGNTAAPAQRAQASSSVTSNTLSRRERRAARRAAKRAAAPAAPARRVEFRYPDQPDTFYGEQGARSDVGAAPLSFSSGSAAISQEDAAKLTVGTPPPVQVRDVASAPGVPAVRPNVPRSDPAITAGGFDARAVAARTAQLKEAQYVSAAGPADFTSAPIETAPLPVLQKAVVQTPVATSATKPVSGNLFAPVQTAIYDKTGQASVFDPVLNGQPTSNGEVLDTNAMIAAHPSLPLPSLVQLINLENDREVVVRVNDRGPIAGNGLIEVSERAADVLGFTDTGGVNVRVRYLGPAPQVDAAPNPVQPVARPASQTVGLRKPVTAQKPLFAPTRPATVTGQGDLFVQLASFADIGNAQRLHATLNGRVQNVEIIPVQVKGTDYFRVVAGPMSNRKDAERLRDSLANQGIGRGLIIAAP